jgi:hypothetical protein
MDKVKRAIDAAPGIVQDASPISGNRVAPPLHGVLMGSVAYKNGDGIAGVDVTVSGRHNETHWPTLRSDESGGIVLVELPPGNYTITIDSENPRIHVTKSVTIVPARQAWFDVRIDRPQNK